MRRIFDSEAPFWVAMGKVADIVLLNLLTVAFSIPLITIGASLTALYDTARKVLSDTGGGTTGLFVRSWWSNLGAATLLWLILGPTGLAIAWSWFALQIPELLVLKVLVSAMYLLVFPFVWAVQARFENRVGRTLLNAVLITVARLPLAGAILLIDLGLIGLALVVAWYLPQGLFLLAMLGYPLIAFANTPILERALRPLLDRASEGPDPDL